MPRQLVAVAPHKADIHSYQEPAALAAGQVRVQVHNASPKHGSELAGFRGQSPHTAEYYDEDWRLFLPRKVEAIAADKHKPWNIGNQFVGTVSEVGSAVTTLNIGDRVCGYSGIRQSVVIGAGELLKMPDDMPWKNAVCYDPAHFALSGVRDAHVRPGDRVAVFGLGAIGQIAVQFARLAGAIHVAAVDPIELRRDVAVRNGADQAFDPTRDDVGLELKRATGRLGVDAVIDTSANEHALQHALRGIAYGGTIAYVGWARAFTGGMDWGREAHFNSARIIFSRACSQPDPDHPRWTFDRVRQTCWHYLVAGRLACEDIVYPVVPFDESAGAYEKYVDQHPELSIKLGVQM